MHGPLRLRADGIEAAVLPYGARLVSVRTPDRTGRLGEITLALADADAYRRDTTFQGACVGRYANRIAGGRFELDGVRYQVPCREPGAALHGGVRGFESVEWTVAEASSDTVRLEMVSPDGDQGFPGTLRMSVRYTVHSGALTITHRAETDAPTVFNPTNHTYWNLAGGGSVEDHRIRVRAERYLPIDTDLIPLGDPAPVAATPFDLRETTRVGDRLRADHEQLRRARGIDHTYVLDPREAGDPPDVRLTDPASGRVLELRTDRPGVQVYTGNMLDGTLVLADGCTARQGDALCLEPQLFPDSPNRPSYPSAVLRPRQHHVSGIALRFGVEGAVRV